MRAQRTHGTNLPFFQFNGHAEFYIKYHLPTSLYFAVRSCSLCDFDRTKVIFIWTFIKQLYMFRKFQEIPKTNTLGMNIIIIQV